MTIFAKVDAPSLVSLCRRDSRRRSKVLGGDQIGGIGFQQAQEGQIVFVVTYSDIAFVTFAVSLGRDIGENFPEEAVAGIGPDIESGNADGPAEEDLPSFALDGGLIGDVVMVDFPFDYIAAGQGGDQILHIHRLGHIFPQAVEKGIAASFEPSIARGGKNPLAVRQVDGHTRIEDPHLTQVFLQPLMIADHAVQPRTGLRREQGDEVIDQPKIGYQIALQVEHFGEGGVQPAGAERGEGLAQKAKSGLCLPATPDHPQVGVIEFVRQKTEDLLGMKIAEIEAVRGGTVGIDEERQEVLDNLYHQIAEILFHPRGKGRIRISGHLRQYPAAEGDMGAVVGQAGVRGIGQNHKVAGDDSGIFQFTDGVELAARQGLVAQFHVAVFLFAAVPAGKAGADEQVAIVAVRDDGVEMLLPGGGMRRAVQQTSLPRFFEPEGLVGVLDEQLTDEQSPRRFGSGQVADPSAAGHRDGEAEDLR